MIYYISNEHLDTQITEIKKKIRLLMNGVVADSMKKNGIIYKQNYGVALPDLRNLASTYKPSNDLAQRLWVIGGRETMILSILLQPIDSFTFEQAINRIESIKHNEIAELICMFLLSKTSYAPLLCVQLTESPDLQIKSIGFMLAARVYNQLKSDQINMIIANCKKNAVTENYQLYKSIALCLGRLARINTETANTIKILVDNFQHNETPSERYITNELKQELEFLKQQFVK